MRPLGEHGGEFAGVFVVARHLHGRLGAAALQIVRAAIVAALRLLPAARAAARLVGVGTREQLELAVGDIERAEAGGAEEDDGVADALAAEAGQRLGVLGHDADQAAIRTVQEGGVLVSERCRFERMRCVTIRA